MDKTPLERLNTVNVCTYEAGNVLKEEKQLNARKKVHWKRVCVCVCVDASS